MHWKSRAKVQMSVPVMALLKQLVDERKKLDIKFKLYPPKVRFHLCAIVL